MDWQQLSQKAAEQQQVPPEGPTLLFARTAEWTTASTGKQMLKIGYRIEDGPAAGGSLTGYLVVSPDNEQALSILMRNLAAHGVDTKTCKTDADVANGVQGSYVTATIEHQEWDGEIRARIKGYKRVEASASATDDTAAQSAGDAAAQMFSQ